MLGYIGWALCAVLALLILLLVCPVRYRCEVGNEGGFLDIILLLGLYKKHIALDKKLGTEEEKPEEGIKAAGSHEAPAPDTNEPQTMNDRTASQPEMGKADREARRAEQKTEESIEETASESPAGSGDSGNAAPEEDEEAPRRPSSARVLLYAWRNGTIHLTLAFLRQIVRHAGPKEFLITGTAGLGDPMETGLAAGLAYAMLPGICRIDWNYTDSICRLTAKIKGRIIPIYLLWIGGRFLAEKPVRDVWRYRKTGEKIVRSEE